MAVGLMAGSALQGGRLTCRHVLENRTDHAWIIREAKAPGPADPRVIRVAEAAQWTDQSSASLGFCGILHARASMTLLVISEAADAPLDLELVRASPVTAMVNRIRLEPASGPPPGEEDPEAQGNDIILEDAMARQAPAGPASNAVPALPPDAPGHAGMDRQAPPAGLPGSAPNRGPAAEGTAVLAMTIYNSRNLRTIFAPLLVVPGLENLAGPLGVWSEAAEACGRQFSSQQDLLAQALALGPTPEPRRREAMRRLLELREGQVRKAFLIQAGLLAPTLQARLLQRLAAAQRRMVKLPPAAQTRADALATEYAVLTVARQILLGLARDWDGVAGAMPWAAWRPALGLPALGVVPELCKDWEDQGGGPLPAFLKDEGQGLLRLVSAGEREQRLAAEHGLELDRLSRFDPAAWRRGLAEQRAAAEARQAALQAEQARERAAAELERSRRAEDLRLQARGRQEALRERGKREQEAKRESAGRAKAQRRQEREQRAEAARLAEAALKVDREREAGEAQRKADERQALEAQRTAAKAKRAEEAKAAERAQALASAAEAKAARETAKARLQNDRKGGDFSRLLVRPDQPLSPHMKARVTRALEQYRRARADAGDGAAGAESSHSGETACGPPGPR
jgi:hypothetical protein